MAYLSHNWNTPRRQRERAGKMEAAMQMVRAGLTGREIMKVVGTSHSVVREARKRIGVILCGCGQPVGHRGICASMAWRRPEVLRGRQRIINDAEKRHSEIQRIGKKKCTKCHRVLPLASFAKDRKLLCGHQKASSQCKSCALERTMHWHRRNKHRGMSRALIRSGREDFLFADDPRMFISLGAETSDWIAAESLNPLEQLMAKEDYEMRDRFRVFNSAMFSVIEDRVKPLNQIAL